MHTLLSKMIDDSRRFDAHKEDYSGRDWKFEFTSPAILKAVSKLNNTAVPGYSLDDNATEQFYGRMGSVVFPRTSKSLPGDFMKAIGSMVPHLTTQLQNEFLARYNGKAFVRTYKDRVRAFLSTSYVPFDNTKLLEMAGKAVDQVEQSTNAPVEMNPNMCIVTPNAVHARITVRTFGVQERGGSNEYGVGVYIGNDETGNGRLRMLPGIQRGSCQNSLLLNWEKGVNLTHRGLYSINERVIAAAMLEAFNLGLEGLDRFLEAQEIEIPDIAKEIEEFAKKKGWSISVKNDILVGTEGQSSLFGLVNGITHAAKKVSSDEDRVNMEILAGEVLMTPEDFFQKAWAKKQQEDQQTAVPVYVNRR